MARPTRRKNPMLSAAVLKVSLRQRGEPAGMFVEIYEGVLRDFDLKDEDVEAFIEANQDQVERLAKGNGEG